MISCQIQKPSYFSLNYFYNVFRWGNDVFLRRWVRITQYIGLWIELIDTSSVTNTYRGVFFVCVSLSLWSLFQQFYKLFQHFLRGWRRFFNWLRTVQLRLLIIFMPRNFWTITIVVCSVALTFVIFDTSLKVYLGVENHIPLPFWDGYFRLFFIHQYWTIFWKMENDLLV